MGVTDYGHAIRTFLGLVGYYKSFIQSLSSIAAPLAPLTRKEECFEWIDACEQTFQTLKERLMTAPMLSLSDGHVDLVVYSDTPSIGIGCVLMKKSKVIAYASKQLKVHEQSYATHNWELAALVFALCIWRHFLYGVPFKLLTDLKSLKCIFM